jgi:hypothetical protein
MFMDMKIYFFLLIFISASAFATPQPCGGNRTDWYACKTDGDCMIYSNMCGFKEAFNQKFESVINKYNQCMGPMISCATPEQDPNKNAIRAICKNTKCAFATADK